VCLCVSVCVWVCLCVGALLSVCDMCFVGNVCGCLSVCVKWAVHKWSTSVITTILEPSSFTKRHWTKERAPGSLLAPLFMRMYLLIPGPYWLDPCRGLAFLFYTACLTHPGGDKILLRVNPKASTSAWVWSGLTQGLLKFSLGFKF